MPLSVIVGVMCVRVHALACVCVRKSTDLTCPSDPCCPTPGPSPQPAPPLLVMDLPRFSAGMGWGVGRGGGVFFLP